jgi:hypothetical protein
MNEIHVTGIAKSIWTYDGNLYVRISVARDGGRPNRAPSAGGSFDYITVLFPGGAQQGLRLRKGQTITAHGWLQSRDVHEGLDDFLRRAQRRTNGSSNPEQALAQVEEVLDEPLQVHRSVNEVVAERWSVS